MKIDLHVTGIEDCGDDCKVSAQGSAHKAAKWRPMLWWVFSVPEHIGKRYRIGDKLKIEVKRA